MTTTNFTPWIEWLDAQYDEMLAKTIELAEINSGTLNADGVNKVRELLTEYCQVLDGDVEVVPVAPYEHLGSNGEVEKFPAG